MSVRSIVQTPAVLRPAILAAAMAVSGCQGAPAPGAGASPAPAQSAPAAATRPHPADVAFVQGMLVHHGQALEMSALVEGRTANPTIARLADRIRASQQSEIRRMRDWLGERGEAAGGADAHDAHDPARHAAMPGMISPDEMGRLAAARGAEFDRRFLEHMTRHHQGALTMVADLLATEGAGQEPELFRLISEIDADQRAEIARMQQLLTNLDPESP